MTTAFEGTRVQRSTRDPLSLGWATPAGAA
ncbi:MAG: hypothetical protein QOK02_3822, partial [Mycobacterium sp.]|nr:hypothetical protein [Mycobacterium sp.]